MLETYGFLTVVPLLIMLLLVIITNKVFESILISTMLVYILNDGIHFITGFTDSVYEVFAEGTYPWILLMLTLFGALINVLMASGGISAFKAFATRYIKSERSSLVFTWILGMVLFIDDYINNLGIGPTVREITDKYKVPREQLGFAVCCTGTPVCAMVPLTAFAVFVFGVMQDSGISGADAGMLSEYIKVIPFMFYPMIIILVSLLLAVGVLPRVGPFKRYYRELKEGSYSLSDSEAASMEEAEDIFEGKPEDAKLLDFALPVVLLVGVMLATSDLVLSVIIGLAAAFALYIPRKKMSVTKYFEHFFSGVNDMVYILIIVLMTFVFVRGLNAIGFSEYVIEMISPVLSGGAIPVLTFVTVGVIAFLGVDYWAVMLLIAPVSIPLALQFGVCAYLTVGAFVSGSVFGGTACFFAEQILMCSQAVQRPPLRVALGGLPYSIFAFALTAVLYLVTGFAL
ncbi:MAG: hypothetical protein LBL36_06640 [Clostridiales Family XIII bacterium]|nr:hypothetical protein [Clostridiales Family XIII bacterium]